MKKILFYFGGIVSSFALMITSININSPCLFLAHQPKIPKEAEKLSKY